MQNNKFFTVVVCRPITVGTMAAIKDIDQLLLEEEVLSTRDIPKVLIEDIEIHSVQRAETITGKLIDVVNSNECEEFIAKRRTMYENG